MSSFAANCRFQKHFTASLTHNAMCGEKILTNTIIIYKGKINVDVILDAPDQVWQPRYIHRGCMQSNRNRTDLH